MSETLSAQGQCVCGACKFKAEEASTSVGACHCKTCRQWGGGPLMTVDCGTEVTFTQKENVHIFDSSKWAERGFCDKCGSHLFYRLKHSQQHMMLVGLFTEGLDFKFDHQVFIDEKPNYYCFSNDTQDLTRPEVFALYGA
ncbi:MAG: GFA family protein [Bermanella sp.]